MKSELIINKNILTWASEFPSWGDTLDYFVAQIKNKEITVINNEADYNNGRRNIPIEKCNVFVLFDVNCTYTFIN